MPNDNRNIPTIDRKSNFTLGKKPPSVKSQKGQSAKITVKNRTLHTQRKNVLGNLTRKEQNGGNISSQRNITDKKETDSKSITKFTDKCPNDMDYDNKIAVLRKEIQNWKVNEILTSRTGERFIATPSEHRTFSYVASGETTKRQRSPNNPLKSVRTYVDFPAVTL
ncbi:uncharacterized protein LOC116426114 isoform X2 [Nomia melanderi]